MQLVSTNFPGNLHSASDQINKLGLAEFVLHMASTGHHTVVVFRVDDRHAPLLRRDFGHAEEFCANPVVTRRFGGYSNTNENKTVTREQD